MNHVPDEILAAIALGDDVDPDHRDHVDGCPVCSVEVAELAQVDALMRAEARPAAASGATDVLPVRIEPSPGLWQRIVAETAETAETAVTADGPDRHEQVDQTAVRMPAPSARPDSTPADRPDDLTARRQAAASAGRAGPPPVRRRAWWIVAAAAACVIAGAFFGRALWTGGADGSTQVVASTSLNTLDAARQQEGTAELLDARGVRELKVDATSMPAGNGYVEVWLINADGKRMVSLGVMSTPQEVFAVPAGAIEQGYTIVDLSHEQFDDKPQHSGDSIMRGTLPA